MERPWTHRIVVVATLGQYATQGISESVQPWPLFLLNVMRMDLKVEFYAGRQEHSPRCYNSQPRLRRRSP